jgi:hypothetical protein
MALIRSKLGSLAAAIGIGVAAEGLLFVGGLIISSPFRDPWVLMMAAADDKLPLAKVLVAKGISPNTMAGGSTALDVACSSRNLDVVRFLIEEGADLSHASSCANLDIKSSSSGSQ